MRMCISLLTSQITNYSDETPFRLRCDRHFSGRVTPLRVQIERFVREKGSAESYREVNRRRLDGCPLQKFEHRDMQHVERKRDIAQHPHPSRRLAVRTLAKNIFKQKSHRTKGTDPENERNQVDLKKLGNFAMFEPIAGLDRNTQRNIDREHRNDRSHDAAAGTAFLIPCETQARQPYKSQQQQIQAESGARVIGPVEKRSSAGVNAERNERNGNQSFDCLVRQGEEQRRQAIKPELQR
jgi:hypothetical protein